MKRKRDSEKEREKHERRDIWQHLNGRAPVEKFRKVSSIWRQLYCRQT